MVLTNTPTRLSRSMAASSKRLRVVISAARSVRQDGVHGPPTPRAQRLPPWHGRGLGVSRFARRYYGNNVSSSGYVRCFSWPGALLRNAGARESASGLPH